METRHKKENARKVNQDMLGRGSWGQQARKHANDILVFLPRNLIWGCHGELCELCRRDTEGRKKREKKESGREERRGDGNRTVAATGPWILYLVVVVKGRFTGNFNE